MFIIPIKQTIGKNIIIMWSLIKSLSAPLLSLVFMMLASGFFNTFVSLRLEIEGVSSEMIGVVTSALYVGILVGSLLKVDRWIIKTGHIRSFVILASLLTALALVQSFLVNPWFWAVLRFLGGICTAGVFIIIESWVLMQSAPNMRGGVLSIYLGVFYGALSCGQFFIDLTDPLGIYPFIITALFVVFSILPITTRKVTEPLMKEAERLTLHQLFKISPLSFIGGVISGMILAIVMGLVPVYAKEIGMTVSEVGTFMAMMIFGGFSLQWPVGRWADKTDRRCVIKVMSFLAAFFGLGFGFAGHSYILHLVLAWFFGGFAFTLYPLSMAYACERVQESQIVAATGGFVLSYGFGAITGPLIAPLAMSYFGPEGLFYFMSFIAAILGLVGFKRPSPIPLK